MKLVETLMGMVLMLLVLTGVVTLVQQTTRLAEAHPNQFELHQRARVALDLVTRDLRSAGAGVDRGPATGALSRSFPPVWPRRLGRGGDPATTARPDALTLVAVPDTLAQAVAASDVWPFSSTVVVETPSHCVVTRPACGFNAGTTLGVFDVNGQLTLWSAESVTGETLVVRPLAESAGLIAAGAVVTELLVRGYMHDPATRQLRYFDGDGTNQPVIDGVTGWSVRYFDAFAELPIAALADGPWQGSGATMFDVDALRIRRVRVDLTLTEGRHTFRATAEVAPRNLTPSGGLP